MLCYSTRNDITEEIIQKQFCNAKIITESGT